MSDSWSIKSSTERYYSLYIFLYNTSTPLFHRGQETKPASCTSWIIYYILGSNLLLPSMYKLVALTLLLVSLSIPYSHCMSTEEIKELREESKDMFYHAYNAYLFNAFPADELMPLTCQGESKYHLISFLSYW